MDAKGARRWRGRDIEARSTRQALNGAIREQPGCAKDCNDLDEVISEAINDTERADYELAKLRLTSLGDNAPQLRKLLQTIGRPDEALHHEFGIQR